MTSRDAQALCNSNTVGALAIPFPFCALRLGFTVIHVWREAGKMEQKEVEREKEKEREGEREREKEREREREKERKKERSKREKESKREREKQRDLITQL